MATQQRFDRQARHKTWIGAGRRHANSVTLVLFVTLASLVAGLIPFAYASVFGNTESQTPTTLTAGEAGVWSVFGRDGADNAPKQ